MLNRFYYGKTSVFEFTATTRIFEVFLNTHSKKPTYPGNRINFRKTYLKCKKRTENTHSPFINNTNKNFT